MAKQRPDSCLIGGHNRFLTSRSSSSTINMHGMLPPGITIASAVAVVGASDKRTYRFVFGQRHGEIVDKAKPFYRHHIKTVGVHEGAG